jgi:hypothetical protein
MSDIQNEFHNVNDIKRKLSTSVADLWHIWVDPDSDPDPDIYVIDLQDKSKGNFFTQ